MKGRVPENVPAPEGKQIGYQTKDVQAGYQASESSASA